MTTSRLYKKTLLAVAVSSLTLASQQAAAAGFQLNAQSATGLGRAFAGDAVIADNASVMARNSAAMALFDSHQFSGGVNYINASIDVKNIEYLGAFDIDTQNNSSGTPVPNIYYVHRLNEKVALGIGIYSNFGTTNEFDSNFGAGTSPGLPTPEASVFGGTTKIASINYALSASYRINDQWSIGGGLDIVDGSGELSRGLTASTPGSALDIDASGIGYGFNLGTVFELNEDNRFGLSYHYSPEIEATGTVKKFNSQTFQTETFDHVKLPLPSMLEFSGYHKIAQSKFAVHYSLQYIGWSVFDKVTTNDGTVIKDYDWQDGYHAALGGTYYLNDQWQIRAGYMFDSAAQDKRTSISVPDSNRHWFSAGFGYHFDKHHNVDFGFTYLMGEDVNVKEGLTDDATLLTATTKADAILAGIQYSYSF
jgi:long-chain fatty acid transport protein